MSRITPDRVSATLLPAFALSLNCPTASAIASTPDITAMGAMVLSAPARSLEAPVARPMPTADAFALSVRFSAAPAAAAASRAWAWNASVACRQLVATFDMPLKRLCFILLHEPMAPLMELMPMATGPAAAAAAASPATNTFVPSGSSEKCLVRSDTMSASPLIAGASESANSAPNTCALLRRSWMAPEKPWHLASASLAASPAWPHWSDTPFQAFSDISRLVLSPSMVCMRPRIACFWRTELILRLFRVESADPPCSSMPLSPWMNATSALTGSFFHVVANWDALMPATLANPSSLSPPDPTADSMSDMVLEMAVPADSAPWPVDATEVASASSSVAENPEIVPIEAMRVVTFMMRDSMVAELLPRRTSASPNFGKSSALMSFRIPWSWPRLVAAPSVSRSVAMSRLETVLAKSSSLSVATPSWPPMASISRSWSAVV